MAGASIIGWLVPEGAEPILQNFDIQPIISWQVGFFADLPIDFSGLSFYSAVNLNQSGFSFNSRLEQSDLDLVVNHTTLNFPIMLRYKVPILPWRPFVNVGASLNFHLRNHRGLQSLYFTGMVVL